MPIAELAAPSPPSACRPASNDRERRLRFVRPLVVDGGCDVRLRGGPHADGVRVALLEWLPLSRAELAEHERDRITQPSPSWLAILVRPPTIWSLEEAVAAARLLAWQGPLDRMPPARLVGRALGRVDGNHLTRVRRRAARVAAQVPRLERPRTGARVEAECALIEADDEACASVAAIALARYSRSRVVAREAQVLHLP